VSDFPQGKRKIVIAASRPIYEGLAARLQGSTGRQVVLLRSKEELSVERLSELDPEFIFLPHWSYIIPRAIYERYECVVFHMTDLPFGRGGSPLQNLIARGIYETRISALRCGEGIDTGPVYLKRPFSLHGNAEEIYLRAARTIEGMIVEILDRRPEPRPQEGEASVFPRRKPEEGNLAPLENLEKVFDYIRMLDAEGYPRAFLETEHFRFEFSRASLQSDSVIADVRIVKK
jgi:methionyl-tRNA formyltransferase